MPPKKRVHTEGEAAATPGAGSLSLNPVFACTGPRAGLLSYTAGKKALDELLDVVDDTVYQVLEDAWEAVGVPAADYWRARPQLFFTTSTLQSPAGIASAPEVRVPNPQKLVDSFYGSRLAALRGRGYRTNDGLVVLAVDRRAGNGSKLFNVFPRDSIADFLAAISRPYDRSLYVLLDEQAPIDPYFDLDCSFTASARSRQTSESAFAEAFPWWATRGVTPVGQQEIEQMLYSTITFLQRYIAKHLDTAVEQCLVLTSCVQTARRTGADPSTQDLMNLKVSFHVHFRLHDQHVMASVRDLHLFMSLLRDRLDALLSRSGDAAHLSVLKHFDGVASAPAELLSTALMVRKCVDFGVYTRWRAFRLPYSVKTPFATADGPAADFTVADAAVDELLASQLARCGAVAEVPDVSVGAAAPSLVQSIVLSADPTLEVTQRGLVKKMSYLFRFLLPVVAGVTQLSYAPLKAFLEALAPRVASMPNDEAEDQKRSFGSAVLGLATIQRDGRPQDTPDPVEQGTATAGGALHLLHFTASTEGGVAERAPAAEQGAEAIAAAATSAIAGESPFACKMPPRPRSARVAVTEAATRNLLAEVFACLAPQYVGLDPDHSAAARPSADFSVPAVAGNQCVVGERLQAQYQESLRAYYVLQKQNKYCLRQGRVHKSTYAQLYLTYGSIKVRCYANDCCERCLLIPWTPPRHPVEDAHFAQGFPKYDRLAAIRNLLFPELPLDELVRRYGPAVLNSSSSSSSDSAGLDNLPQHQESTAAL